MSVNKNAFLRYKVLDKCFSNFQARYYFEDLLEEVNNALLDDDPKNTGIKTRQLRDDIRFMKSEAGYAAPIVTIQDGRKAYYKYDDKDFSIHHSPLNTTEAEQLKNAVSILQRFEGAPGFEWVHEMSPAINDLFGLKDSKKRIMAFESNIDYSGYKYITPIFNAITNKRVLEIKYEPFGKPEFVLQLHPYFLKQYNNRWFFLGYNEEKKINTWIGALDRIKDITEIKKRYKSDKTDWDEHFDDIIGVSKLDQKPIEVELHFDKEQAPYVITKPLHLSQKPPTFLPDGTVSIRITVIPNFELETQLLSFGEKVKVIKPKRLQNKLRQRLHDALYKY